MTLTPKLVFVITDNKQVTTDNISIVGKCKLKMINATGHGTEKYMVSCWFVPLTTVCTRGTYLVRFYFPN
jgi:hypothetical protein